MMKKVLMLGGSPAQVPSITKAVEMGYHVIICDYLDDNPGQNFSHGYHKVSTTDKDAVLELAKRLRVDGVVCYASDPAAATAAYVCEQMGFPTSPYRSVEILSNKDKFRAFLQQHHFNTPKAKAYAGAHIQDAIEEIGSFTLPVMIKPVDSSGSKGVTKLERVENAQCQIEYALSFSRAKRFIIEEFVESNGYQVAGDGFSVDGKLVFRCFANDHFDTHTKNPFVPVGASWPYLKPKSVHDKIHDEIQRLLTLLDMRTGAYNFDVRIDNEERVFLMEIGPRCGGNMIPQVIQHATGVDLVEYTIKAAMGIDCSDLKMKEPEGFWAYHVVRSLRDGTLRDIVFDEDFKANNLVQPFKPYRIKGDTIEVFDGANKALGVMTLTFGSVDEMIEKIEKMDQLVRVELDGD